MQFRAVQREQSKQFLLQKVLTILFAYTGNTWRLYTSKNYVYLPNTFPIAFSHPSEAVATVSGSREVHIEEGSQLALECQVQRAPVPPIYIFWYHNGTMVNYNQNLQVRTENFTSNLVVSTVTGRDAGTYTCEPQLATPANVTVHVVTGQSTRETSVHCDMSGIKQI